MTTLRKTINRLHQKLLWAMCLAPTTTFAASIESILNNSIRFLQGPLARSVGILIIIGCGYLCIAKQKFPKEQFAMVLVGLGIVFGGSSLYSVLVG
ncbi:vir protein [Legionella rubrilucens]|uniref:Vir protein n=1 Tax=Legionella rubrilucens TaxID=458 RepID=A0A0W0XXV4_9GAMM|nr:TrbC/VirB2 family protein [Legionella rubrilucens]KTD49607.1 vir protein [Legionella rubrilucens]